MARTPKDVVSYFPHDAHASVGDTLTILQSRFGNNGYAAWFKLLEKLSASEGHYLDCRSPIKWNLLIAYLGTDEITTVEILSLLVEMQAIDKDLWDSKLIWCQKLVDNIADVYKNRRREIPQKPIIMDSNALTTKNKALTTAKNPQSKVNKTKLNKTKLVGNDNSPADRCKDINKIYDKFLECFRYEWGRVGGEKSREISEAGREMTKDDISPREPGAKERSQMRYLAQELVSAGGCPLDTIREAFREAAAQEQESKRKIPYVRAILFGWLEIEEE